ncbi:MAG TPA: lipid-A-disaccharide synthase [Gemmatimonadales bacterium]|nr:lipid-A-disaccharide synthase [Gemmatimonadales bacterium]
MASHAPRVFLSAGEPSGDLHGGAVVRALRDRLPGISIDALGGPCVRAAGATVRHPMERYTVLGFVEVLGKIPAHVRLLRQLEREFRAGAYDLALLIDYPGFNVRVAEAAHRHGVKVLYYIAPQLWAWRPGRARKLARAVDRLAAVLPFEPAFFARHGINAEYVGHPLLDRPALPTRNEARQRLGIGAAERVLGLFPGSRPQETARLWAPFRDAARRLRALGACERVLVAGTADGGYPGSEGFQLHRGASEDVFAAADVALAKSGTTTLEAAVADLPMVVAYRVHPLTSWLARRLITVPWISLVNLVADAPVVPELTQGSVTPERLVEAATPLLDPAHPKTLGQREGLRLVRERLGGGGAAGRVAALAAELLG